MTAMFSGPSTTRVAACLALAFLSTGLHAGGTVAGGGGFYRGMALGLFSRGEPAFIQAQIEELRPLGVDAVSLIVPKAVADVRSAEFLDDPLATPTDAALVEATRRAHAAGMRVMLFPLVYVQKMDDGEWRGTLAPPDWDAWFRAYGEVVLRYARLAEAERVEILSVGSELCSSEAREAQWRALIGAVRAVYRGRILYSANWDHFRDIRFADALDFVGVNAYYRLAGEAQPSVETLVAGWAPHREALVAWAREHRRPLLFTEVGYPSRAGAADDPWDYTAERPADPELQRRCYRAFVETWSGVPELAGAFFYLWWGEGGPADRDYTPRGKPASVELARWFRDGAGDAAPKHRNEEGRR